MAKKKDTAIYKELKDFPGYRIGSDGSIWSSWKRHNHSYIQSSLWRRLRGKKDTNGYLFLSYRNKGYPVARLVLLTFVGPCPLGKEACHNNGCKTDNRVENLRWDTHKANSADLVLHGTCNWAQGELNGNSKLTENDVRSIRKEYEAGLIFQELAKKYVVNGTTISSICRRKTWKHLE